MSEEMEKTQETQQATENALGVTVDDIRQVLKEHVYDPEIGINVVDLGLVYDIKLLPEEKKVIIDMTLTSPACPVGPQILASAQRWIHETFPQLDEVEINLVWTPLWNPSMMSEEAKDILGIF